jgi:transcriptional repressor p66
LQDRSRQEDNQTPAQRQAAAKLALRKQLEKTLLQVIVKFVFNIC